MMENIQEAQESAESFRHKLREQLKADIDELMKR